MGLESDVESFFMCFHCCIQMKDMASGLVALIYEGNGNF